MPEFFSVLTDLLGTIGVVIMLYAYFQLQKGTWPSDGKGYLWCNFIGALLILCSLVFKFNLPAFIIETAWAVISLWGLVKRRKNA